MRTIGSRRSGSLLAAGFALGESTGALALLASAAPGCDYGSAAASPAPSPSPVQPALTEHYDVKVAAEVVAFWREAGPSMWFAKDPAFDQRFRERFMAQHEAAARGELDDWLSTAEGALGLVLLLDQYPRNSFRGTPRMYATDAKARAVADVALAAGHDQAIDQPLRLFLYLPFGHSENLADQERSVELAKSLGEPALTHAKGHRDIVKRFGRFPHRNPILGRPMRPEEQRFLDEGGFKG